MADSHSTSDFAVSGTERHLIVGYRPQGRDTTTPSLTFPASGYAQRGSILESASQLR